MTRSNPSDIGCEAFVDLKTGGEQAELDVVLRRTEVDRLKRDFIEVAASVPPVPQLPVPETSRKARLSVVVREARSWCVESHYFSRWVREQKQVRGCQFQEIARAVLD